MFKYLKQLRNIARNMDYAIVDRYEISEIIGFPSYFNYKQTD